LHHSLEGHRQLLALQHGGQHGPIGEVALLQGHPRHHVEGQHLEQAGIAWGGQQVCGGGQALRPGKVDEGLQQQQQQQQQQPQQQQQQQVTAAGSWSVFEFQRMGYQ
jgi:hypothetical protein